MWPAKCAPGTNDRRFCLVLVKPSHYDDDGYVIQWHRSAIPSNSLAALYGLALDCAERRILGDDVDIDVHAFDETNTRIRPDATCGHDRESRRRHGHAGGRAVEPVSRARSTSHGRCAHAEFMWASAASMSPASSACCRAPIPISTAPRNLGCRCSPAKPRGGSTKCCATPGPARLQPLYNFMNDLPSIQGAPMPVLPRRRVTRTFGSATSFDAGRGCPYQCSFCTIINVQGRKSRRRSPDDIERIIRLNLAQGLNRFFITDDNFARNKDWEPILDRMIKLREVENLKFNVHHSGRHALSPASELYREMRPRRRAARFHRAREHQSRQPARRQEAPEQDHRIPRHAAGMEVRGRDDLCRLHPGIPQRHRGVDPARHRGDQEGACRSTSWSSSI